MFSTGTTYFLILIAVYILLVWGALIPFRAGLLYNGTVYCMAIGGYFAAFASKTLHWPFLAVIIGSMVVGAILGFLPALGFSRTSGIITAVSSMALIFIIQSVIKNLEFLGGSSGIRGVPKIDNLLLWTFILVVIMGVLLYRLDHSRLGRALEAIQTDNDMATVLGINNRQLIILALTLSSLFAALAGALFTYNIRVIYPKTFGFSLLLNVMTMLFVGGRYTQWGILISAPLLWGMSVLLPPELAQMSKFIYAALLIIILMVRPEGIVTRSMIHKINGFFNRLFRKAAPEADPSSGCDT